MGQDKAFILFEGVPLLTRICETAKTVANQVFIISPWRSRYQSLIPQGCQFFEEMQLQNTSKPAGPLIAFSQVLPQIKTEWVLLLAYDLPYLTPFILQNWSINLPNISTDAIAFLPRSKKGWEPLSGFYRISCLQFLNIYIKQGGSSFQNFLNQHIIQELFISDRRLLFNCNTPEDLQQLSSNQNNV